MLIFNLFVYYDIQYQITFLRLLISLDLNRVSKKKPLIYCFLLSISNLFLLLFGILLQKYYNHIYLLFLLIPHPYPYCCFFYHIQGISNSLKLLILLSLNVVQKFLCPQTLYFIYYHIQGQFAFLKPLI